MTVWIGLDGSTINLCILTLERYVIEIMCCTITSNLAQ